MTNTDLAYLTIAEASARIAARTPSAKEGRWVCSSRWITCASLLR